MFEPFQKLIPRAASRYGVAKEVKAAQICHQFRTLIPKIFPQEKFTTTENIQPAYFKDSTLVINVSSSAWAQEVIIRKPEIIDELNKKSAKIIIKNLRTQLKT